MPKRSFASYLLIILSLEKLIQHTVDSVSFFYDIGSLRNAIAVDYRWLLLSGAFAAALFALACFALIRRRHWGLYLVLVLAAFDIIGEFIAQGTFLPDINVSIAVAVVLLPLSYIELRNLRLSTPGM